MQTARKATLRSCGTSSATWWTAGDLRANFARVQGIRASIALAGVVIASMIEVLAPARAHAADALVLSIGGDAPDELAREARAAAVAALEDDGVSVVPEAEIALRVAPARLRAMTSLADARSLAFELEARMIVGVAVWMREGSDPPAADSVAVSLLVGSRSFSATREVGEAGPAAAAGDAMGEVRGQQTRAMLVEGAGLGGGAPTEVAQHTRGTEGEQGAESAVPANARGDQTPGFDVIGPTMLLAFGAGGAGMGVYALLDQTCELRGASGTCLRGEDPNIPIGVVLTIAGGLAIAGGVVWLLTGAAVSDSTRIDVVLGPEGGAVTARGRF